MKHREYHAMICMMYRNGCAVKEITDKMNLFGLGVSRNWVKYVLRRRGAVTPRISDSVKKLAIKRYQEGESMVTIGRDRCVDPQTVSNWLSDARVRKRTTHEVMRLVYSDKTDKRRKRAKEIRRLYSEGKSRSEISRIVGVPWYTVKKALPEEPYVPWADRASTYEAKYKTHAEAMYRLMCDWTNTGEICSQDTLRYVA